MATQSITRTREVGPQSFRAMVAPSTLDVEKRTVQVVWTTGARVLRGYYEPYYEQLSLDPAHVRMDRLRSGTAPLLDSHNAYDLGDVIGVVESAQLESGRGTAVVRFDKGPEGEDAFRKVADGILRNVSVGYRTYKMVQVEGGDATTPVYEAVDWEPMELSMCPIGADAGATTRSERTVQMNPCEFTQEKTMADENPATKLRAAADSAEAGDAVVDVQCPRCGMTCPPGMMYCSMCGTQVRNLQPGAEHVRTGADSEQPEHVRAAAAAAEQERILGIQRIARALKRPDAEVADAIKNRTPLADFRAQAQDKFAEEQTIMFNRNDPRIESGEDARDKWLRGAEAWILQRSGVSGIVAQDAKTRGQQIDLDPGEFRGMRLLDLARQSLERTGVRTAGMLPMELVGQAFTRTSPTATTGDFPILLENALFKVLLAQYAVTPDTWTRFCKTGSVQDFRPSKRYRLGTFGTLSALTENGEFTNKSIPDAERQSLTAGTKGNLIGISRQAIINDDLGAFSTLATALGRAARLSVEVDVYALLALNAGLGPAMSDGNTLFHASHGNITTGAAIGSAAIDADRVAMASQKDPSSNEVLALTPSIIVLPIGLGGTARQINNGQYDFDASNKFQIPNRVGGLFREIIDTPRITGTRRYLFADAGIAPTIEVAFVDGQQQPFMDMQQGWRVDGVEWKVRMDYGVAAIDFRGAVTNAGA